MQIALWIDTPALGDTIAAIPTLRKLSKAYDKPVTVFTTLPEIFEGHPCVLQALPSDADKSDYIVHRTFSPLVGKNYDFLGNKIEFRHSNSEIRQFHAMSLGFNLSPDEMETDLYVEEPLEVGFKDYVIVHPTHTWATRTWDTDKWQKLIDDLNDQGIPVVAIGRDSKEVGHFNVQKPVMDINVKYGVNLLNSDKTTIAALRWMMNHKARAVVTMDSGILHIAGTTDVEIIQLGSSIDPKMRAPYRMGSQSYKYNYIAGSCKEFCSSNMKYNIKVHGSIQGVPPQIYCLDNRPTMECHPETQPVLDAVLNLYPENKKKILFLAPHLSTGGMPEFLLTRIKALREDENIDLYVIEFTLYATSYTVQRDQIKALLPEGHFFSCGDLSTDSAIREERLKEHLSAISPDIIHIEESPEAFDGFNKLSRATQAWIYSNSQSWKVVETCHNIWFDPRKAKRFSPDAYALCSPHHMIETFSEEPSEKQEVHFPIISHKRSETQREKSLEIFGMENLSNAYHIVNIGLWTQGKNQAEAIRWATHLQALYPDKYQFHFVGNQAENFENYWGPLMQALPANVHIHGERSDVDTFYQMADAIAFNSTWECNPLALRQSIGWDIPVMARNLPQYHGMYSQYVTGITGDTAEDCSNLQRALETKIERNIQDSMARFKKDHMALYKKALNLDTKRQEAPQGAEWTIKWDNGPRVTSHTGRDLFCQFLAEGQVVYEHTLKGENHWCKPAVEWYRDWTVIVDGIEHKLDLKDRVATVRFNSGSLGDTLSWVEIVREFRFARGLKKVYLATHKNWLFDKDHYRTQGIEFIAPGEEREDSVADFSIGVYMEDPPGTPWFPNRNKRDWRKIYLGDIASDQLGVRSIQKAPKLTYTGKHEQDRPYICIATQSTAQAKYWNNPTGWQELIDHYNAKGYDVYHVSREGTKLKGVIQAPEAMDKTYAMINGAELFVGISSGLSWLAWATETPIVLISGFTPKECEFQNDRTLRIIDMEVCNGCWAWDHFNRGDWNWCPTGKGNERHFECTKVLTGERVINMIAQWQEEKQQVNETIES